MGAPAFRCRRAALNSGCRRNPKGAQSSHSAIAGPDYRKPSHEVLMDGPLPAWAGAYRIGHPGPPLWHRVMVSQRFVVPLRAHR
jgi:hypothetical protein